MKRDGIIVMFVSVLALLLFTQAGWADVTRGTLKHSVRAGGEGAKSSLTLSDIADITGPELSRLGAIRIIDVSAAAKRNVPRVSVSMSQVRELLEAEGVNLGRIELSGTGCEIELPAKAAQVVSRTKEPRASEPRVPQAVDMTGPATMRTRIAARIAGLLNVTTDDLRLLFDDADEALLNDPVGGRRVDIQPASGAASGRVPVQITAYDGDRVVLSRMVSAGVLVKRRVVTATQSVERGEPLSPEHYEISDRWVPPSSKVSVDEDKLRSAVASGRLQAGQVIGTGDVGQPIVCKRGDIIYVHALSGGITVKAKARAMSAARDGEMVQLKLDGSDRVFSARMSGAGRAVLLVMPSDAGPTTQVSSGAVLGTPTPGRPGTRTPGARKETTR
jgi:flagella basal body P-ring formation protein FlgA